MKDHSIAPGETVRVQITRHLAYDITNTGWTLRVRSNRAGIAVKPNADGSIEVVSTAPPEDDEV